MCLGVICNSLAADLPKADSAKSEFFRARAEYFSGNLNESYRLFSEICEKDPKNKDAVKFLERASEDLKKKGDLDRQKTRITLLKDVTEGWQQPKTCVAPQKDSTDTDKSTIWEKLRGIEIPKISFSAIPLNRALDLLGNVVEELDKSTSKIKGVNIVLIDPQNQNPQVNLTLRNISLIKVLEFISKSVNFQFDVENEAVVFRPCEDKSIALETQFFPISRAAVIRLTGKRSDEKEKDQKSLAEEEKLIKNFLDRAGVNFDVVGSNLAFEGTRLIVTQTKRNLDRIKNILTAYAETKQVEIEAKFLEVQEGALEEIGFRWTLGNGGKNVQTGNRSLGSDNLRSVNQAFAYQDNTQGKGKVILEGRDPIEIPNRAPTMPNHANLGASAVPVVDYLGKLGKYDVGMLIRALEEKTGSDLMSAPKLTVLSGTTAQIVIAQELRYPEKYGDIHSSVGTGSSLTGNAAGVTVTAGTPMNFATRNIGVEMAVTPTVEENDAISLKLEPCVTEFEGFVEYGGNSVAMSDKNMVHVPSGFFQPIFSTRKIKTEVTIFDGATVVMGGLTREELKEVKDKIPILGDIPLLGNLFRSKGQSSQKRNLLIFVTANILTPTGSPTRQLANPIQTASLFQSPRVVPVEKK